MRFWSGVIAAGFVATVGLSAQQNPPGGAPAAPGGQANRPAPTSQASGQGKSVTISGCIQTAPGGGASATAAAGGATASASTSKFVLANAKMSGGGAVGTTGSASATRYQLQGEEKAIAPHLNHQVEITGMVDTTASAGGGAAGAQAGGGAAGSSSQAGPVLKVESVKMVSATCS
jgi:hypothetical protein